MPARRSSADGSRSRAAASRARTSRPLARTLRRDVAPAVLCRQDTPPADGALLRAFVYHAPVALAMFDRRMRYLAVSRRWLTDFRLGSSAVIGRTYDDVLPEPPGRWRALYTRALAGRVVRPDEQMLTRPGGARRWLRTEIRPWRRPSGAIGGIIVFCEDITRRKIAEQALHQSKLRLQAVLDNAVDAIITIDGSGVIQSVNPATQKLFGYTQDELVGRNVRVLMPSPHRDEHDRYLERYRKTGQRRIIGIGREVEAVRKDGTVFAADLAVSEVEPGRLFTGMIRDISDRKLAEARVRESDRLASIGTLAAGLGHDMNNVLLPVRAHLNAVRSATLSGGHAAFVRRHVEEVRKSIAYLQQLADGLHFLAMDADADDRDGGHATDLHRWWAQAGALLSKAVPKHVGVRASIPAHLPPVPAAAHGLTQAVLNLIVNAGEAIQALGDDRRRRGLVQIRAEVRPGEEDPRRSYVRVAVTDNGAGMTDQVRRRAFEMFYTTKPRGLGTGLGLALVRNVVERAGGRVTIDSRLGHGTTVTLWFPAVTPASAGRAAPATTAVVVVADGRAASLLTHLLGALGAIVLPRGPLSSADILVLDGGAARPAVARSWRRKHPRGHLVLFGAPASAADWNALGPVTIEAKADLPAIRSALAAVVAHSKGGSSGVQGRRSIEPGSGPGAGDPRPPGDGRRRSPRAVRR